MCETMFIYIYVCVGVCVVEKICFALCSGLETGNGLSSVCGAQKKIETQKGKWSCLFLRRQIMFSKCLDRCETHCSKKFSNQILGIPEFHSNNYINLFLNSNLHTFYIETSICLSTFLIRLSLRE